MPAAALPDGFVAGVRHFNGGEFFEAHEAFEAVLDEVEADQRWELLLGLIQVAVGYHKWVAGHPGAARMLTLGLEKLGPFPAEAWGVDVDGMRRRVGIDLARLSADPDAAWPDDPPRLAYRSPTCVA